MKKRRTLIISLLLVAALALGIGYAAFGSDMVLNGSIQMGGIASQVNFQSVTRLDSSTASEDVVTLDVTGEGTDTLRVALNGFSHAGHYVDLDIVISNPHDFDVTLTNLKWSNDGDANEDDIPYFLFESLDGSEIDIEDCDGELDIEMEKNSTKTIKLRITCNATSPEDVTENFKLEFKAVA